MKEIYLDTERIKDRESLHVYMEEIFAFGEEALNLDALHDNLAESAEDTCFLVKEEELYRIAKEPYAYKVLKVLLDCVKENPHLHIALR